MIASLRDPNPVPLFCAAALLAGVLLPLDARAQADGRSQAYPTRPVRLVVASAPGGGTEAIARVLGARLAEQLGQPFVVDTRPGAGGIVGTETVARAVPDGHTLLMGFIASLVLTPVLVKAPYDPIRDFTPVSLVASAQYLLTLHPSVPARTLKEFVAHAKANPGKLNYASGGVGTPVHLSAELFKSMAGVNLVHIPYKGGGPAAAAVLSGEAQVIFGSVTATLPQIKAGKLIALATTGLKRSQAAPDYPTIAEQGYPGFDVTSWYGVVGPARMAAPVVAKLNGAIVAALRDPVVREQLARQGQDPIGSTAAEFAAYLKRESVQWGDVIRKAGIKAE